MAFGYDDTDSDFWYNPENHQCEFCEKQAEHFTNYRYACEEHVWQTLELKDIL